MVVDQDSDAFSECVQVLEGHTDYITCLQVVGDRIFSGSYDRSVRCWDLKTDECVQVFMGHSDGVRCLYVVGNTLYTGSNDETVRAWNVRTAQTLLTFKGHTDWVNCLQVDGTLLYTGSYDDTLRAWNAQTGKCNLVFQGHARSVNCLLVQHGILFSGSYDMTLRSWDTLNGQCLQVYQGHSGWVRCLSVADNVLFSGSEDGTARMWNIKTGDCTMTFTGHSVYVKTIQADERRNVIYTSSGDCTVRRWSTLTGQCEMTIKNCNTCMEILFDVMYTGAADGKIRLFRKASEAGGMDSFNSTSAVLMAASANNDLDVTQERIAGSLNELRTILKVDSSSHAAIKHAHASAEGETRILQRTVDTLQQDKSMLERRIAELRAELDEQRLSRARNMTGNPSVLQEELDAVTEALESERRLRQETEKARRAAENEARHWMAKYDSEVSQLHGRITDLSRSSERDIHMRDNVISAKANLEEEVRILTKRLDEETKIRVGLEADLLNFRNSYDVSHTRTTDIEKQLRTQLGAAQDRADSEAIERARIQDELYEARKVAADHAAASSGHGHATLLERISTLETQLRAEQNEKRALTGVRDGQNADIQRKMLQLESENSNLKQANAAGDSRLRGLEEELVRRQANTLQGGSSARVQELEQMNTKYELEIQYYKGLMKQGSTPHAPATQGGARGRSPSPGPVAFRARQSSPMIETHHSSPSPVAPPLNRSQTVSGPVDSGIDMRCSICGVVVSSDLLEEHTKNCRGLKRRASATSTTLPPDDVLVKLSAGIEEKLRSQRKSIFSRKTSDSDGKELSGESKKALEALKGVIKSSQNVKPSRKGSVIDVEKQLAKLGDLQRTYKEQIQNEHDTSVRSYHDWVKRAVEDKLHLCKRESK